MSDFRPQESGDTNPPTSQDIEDIQIEDIACDSQMEIDRQRNHELRAMKNKEKDLENAEIPSIVDQNPEEKKLKSIYTAVVQSYIDYQLDDRIGNNQIAKPEIMLDDSIGTLDSYAQSTTRVD